MVAVVLPVLLPLTVQELERLIEVGATAVEMTENE